jgi:hypothetical protein
MFRITAEPGTFRTQEFENPISAALMPSGEGGGTGGGIEGVSSSPSPAAPKVGEPQLADKRDDDKEKKDSTQALLDTFRAKSLAGKVTGILPVNVAFPAFGPSLFLVSELTSENQVPAAEFNYQREKKGGV